MRIASFSRFAGTLLLSGAASLLWAQGPPPQGEPPPGAPPDTGIDQTVARVSYVEGSVSYARGDDPDQWQGLDPNVPMTIGDRVYTDQAGTIELELAHGGRVEVGPQTDLTAVNMTDQVQQFAVNSGVSSFAVRRLAPGTVFEVDTPNAAVTFDEKGLYRVDVDASGQTRLTVQKGNATIAAGGGQLGVSSGEAIVIQGTDNPRYDVVAPAPPDRFDSFVDSRVRAARGPTSPSMHYVSAAVVGAGDLDRYGTWQSVAGYGNVWAPSGVPVGWAPYRAGRWYWQDPWGWTWISTEPWGWAPYHYGRWAVVSDRWFWVPVAPAIRTVAYAPALVAFVGGPPVGVAVAAGGAGFVGWFPLAPRDPLIPWWGVRPAVNVQVTNITYVNRAQVTVVQQTTFVTGAAVSGAVIRDAATVREVAAAPVVVGRVPVLPTTASIRVAARQAPAPAPPAAIASRTVVTRSVPPPAPPTFQQKLAVIQENKAPVANRAVAPAAATGARTIVAAKPAMSTSGSVQLAPRAASAQNTKRVEPVTSAPPRSAPASSSKPAAAPAPSVNAPSNVERAERGTAPPHAAPPRQPPPTRAAPPPEPAAQPKEKHEAAPPSHGGPPAKASPAPHGKAGGERKPPEQPHRPTPKPEKPE
jgi:FecR protein